MTFRQLLKQESMVQMHTLNEVWKVIAPFVSDLS